MSIPSKILFKVFCFVLPIILLLGFIEYQLRSNHFVSSYAAKKYYLEKSLDNIETLILGSSESFNGIDPSCFTTKTFNLANVSQTLYYDRVLTESYIAKMPLLKNVIINISYFSFFYELQDIKESWRTNYYATHFNIHSPESKNKNYFYITTYSLQQSVRLALNNFKDSAATTILENGYQPKYHQELINDSTGKVRATVHNNEIFKNRKLEIQNNLEKFVAYLKNKNINVIFVTTPVFSSYSKYCNEDKLNENVNFINYLSTQYHCKYVNYFNDARFSKDDFFDNDHLKDNGAKKLSILINQELQQQ